ncbi:MAG TPA: discoidin domain-containing protein [Gaiellaceae bacterium]|nr:discoidin domain-containing protein [Gaiellaceae bacterium]
MFRVRAAACLAAVVLLPACLAAVVLLPGAASAPPAGPAIWFAPLPPLRIVESRPFVGSTDFMQLFSKRAAWPNAARRVSVFKLYGEWVAHTATSAQLRRAVKELKRRKISIAVETGPLEPPPECGQGVEGFAGAEGLTTANRIKEAGGTLGYVAFDEPFYYGALYAGQNACRWDTRHIAESVAAYIRGIRTVFPHVKFGDTEPLTTGAHIDRYKEWIDAYWEVTGESLAFIHLDTWYTLPRWPQLAHELEAFAQSRGVAFGLIYNGDGHDASDYAWLAKAQERFELYETESGRPDHAVLQSWVDKPDRVLPETRRTFTNLILRYGRPRTRLELEASAGEVKGRLLGARPLVGSPIRLSVERTYEGSVYPSSGTLTTASTTTGAGGRFRAVLTAPPGAAIVARYRGSARYWPAYAVAGSGLRNVARGRPVVASAEQTTEPAAYAVDGDVTTSWIAGDFAPQWIEIDLGATFSIAAIRLGVNQFPNGDTVHAVLGRPPGGSYRELHVFRGRTTSGELLEYVPQASWEGIRYLRVETRASPSWVAWREVEVFGSASP